MKRWILVVAVAVAAGCISGTKRGPRGTNVGEGSDTGGPWTRGEQPALVGR